MKFAVKMTKILERTIIVEADNYEEAKKKVRDTYCRGVLGIHDYNSKMKVNFTEDTEVDVETMNISEELR